VATYAETLAWLSGLEVSAGWDLKLERMRAALARRGNPERRWPALHVAGTNGKGSTAAMLEAVLRAAGYRTGLYTSPHLVDFAERARIDGRTIPHATVVELVAELRADVERAGIALTHFEYATLLAFEWFGRVGIDVAVVEVGLGGRLDATNVLAPLATAITSIGIDHVEYLGPDLRSIAAEKAGILKAGVPLALAAVPAEAEDVIVARARALGVPVTRVGADGALAGDVFRGPGVVWDGVHLGLPGAFQRANATLALLTLALVRDRFPCPVDAVRRGLADVRWPGRLAVVSEAPLVVLDGAHNADGIATLVAELPAVVGERRVELVFAAMADKRWPEMLAALVPHVRAVIATRVGRRGAAVAEVAAAVGGRVPVEAVDDPRAALRAALARAGPQDAVLVTGSLFLVGEAYAELVHLGRLGPLFEPWQPSGTGATERGA